MSAVGKSGESIRLAVERGHVRRFADAVGDPHPRYRDESVARAEGHPAIPAPPTFAIALRAPDPRAGLEIDFTKLLHGEQELLFDRPLYVGDVLDVQATIVEAYAKAGKAGVMDFMIVETVGRDPVGSRVFRARSLAVIRR
jgi:acyl dehydratase